MTVVVELKRSRAASSSTISMPGSVARIVQDLVGGRRESHGDASPATPLQIRLDELVGLGDRTVLGWRLSPVAARSHQSRPRGSRCAMPARSMAQLRADNPPRAAKWGTKLSSSRSPATRSDFSRSVCKARGPGSDSPKWRASTYSSRYVPHIGGQSVCCSATTPSAGPSSAS